MRKDDLIRLRHMLEAGQKAVSFAEGRSRREFDEDDMLALTIMKAIEIMGEAASKMSPDSRTQLNEVPWPQIVGMRNRLIHGYDSIRVDLESLRGFTLGATAGLSSSVFRRGTAGQASSGTHDTASFIFSQEKTD